MNSDFLNEQIEELRMFQRIDQELGAKLDFEYVLRLTIDWALRRTGAVAGMFITVSTETNTMHPLILEGYPGELQRDSEALIWTLEQGVMGKAVSTRQPQMVNDLTAVDDYVPRFMDHELKSALAVPIELREQVIGVIWLEGEEPDTFSESDTAFVARLAARAAIALDHARLYDAAERQADNMSSLFHASRMISSSLERQQVMSIAAQSLATTLRVSSVIIIEFDRYHDIWSIAHTYRLPTAKLATDILPRVAVNFPLHDLSEIKQVVDTGKAAAFNLSNPNLSEAMFDYIRRHNFRALLAIPLATAPNPLDNLPSEVMGLALICEGRTERRFSREEIEMAETLGTQIASAMRQARLFESVRELEHLKSQMMRLASHELRNPLGNVIGFYDLLIGSVSAASWTEEQKRYMDFLQRAMFQMKTIIEDLLTLDKVENEREDMWQAVDFRDLVREEIEVLRGSAAAKKHNLSSALAEQPLRVRGSESQLRRALSNYITNAIKYTPDSGFIQVRLYHKESRLIYEVQDNGYGISKERQERLFSRFYRAHEPGTDHIPGTGLGLSLVKDIINRHGGEVWVHSEPNIGSTFGLWLPLVD